MKHREMARDQKSHAPIICRHGSLRRSCEPCDLQEHLDRIRATVKAQAEDEGLWFDAQTAPEGYLQQELRHLHTVVEDF